MAQNATQSKEIKYMKEQKRDMEGKNFNSNAHVQEVLEGKIKRV